MLFDDFAGQISVDTRHMREFMQAWFREDDLITIMGTTVTGYRSNYSFTIPVKELVKLSNEEFEKVTVIESDGRKVSAYFGINPTKEDNTVTLKERGGKANVREIYGCFIDFDVNHGEEKKGVFSSKKDIHSFLDSLKYPPTIIVDNGSSGGIHAYWRLEDQDTPYAEETLLANWWAYISELSSVKVDRLIDKSRVARLPSGIYWPKDDGKFDTIKVVKSDGKRYRLKELLEASQSSADAYTQRIAEIRSQKTRVDVEKWNGWLMQKVKTQNPGLTSPLAERQVLVLMHMIDNHVNNNYSWRDILEPYGWTFLREGSNGSEEWARPGRQQKSATVDYVNPDTGLISPVMSLLTSSEDSGLYDLKEMGIPITKKQVLLRLKYNDDVVKMATDMYSEVMDD